MATSTKELTPQRIGLMVFVVLLFAFTPLLISGQWDWWAAWIYAILSTIGFVASRVLAGRRNPGLLEERSRSLELENARPWDKVLAPIVALGGILIAVVAALDERYGWSGSFPLWARIAALVLFILGYLFGTWAMMENRFFSGVVRIQQERGHTVVSSGPYAWVRHPGYAGTLWVYLATPLLLDSVWALIPAVLLDIVLIIRTRLEDDFLQKELPGYRDYTQRTRYRLLPGIW